MYVQRDRINRGTNHRTSAKTRAHTQYGYYLKFMLPIVYVSLTLPVHSTFFL